jgi:prepilin-type processing-associated H-X9-DG protein
MNTRSRHLGFTIVEVVVVIALIVVLAGFLLSALNHAKRTATLVACSARAKGIADLMRAHATNHEGRFPLAGRIRVFSDEDVPSALSDPERNLYVYIEEQAYSRDLRVAPLPIALSNTLGLRTGNVLTFWEAHGLYEKLAANKTFDCPALTSETRRPVSTTQFEVIGSSSSQYLTNVPVSYAFSSPVLGFDAEDPTCTRNLRGRLERASNASALALAVEGAVDHGPPTMFWIPKSAAGKLTFADALNRPDAWYAAPALDRVRHKGRLNILFADGHVETRRIVAADLGDIQMTVSRP